MMYNPEQWSHPSVEPLVLYGSEIMGYDVNLKNVLIIGGGLFAAWFILKAVKSVTKIILFSVLAFSIIHYGHKYADKIPIIGGMK